MILAPGLSIVIPAYKSAAALPLLADRLRPVLQGLGQPHEVLFVNDGGPDETWIAIQKLASENNWIRGICMMRNYGQHNAVLCGVRAARFSITMTMDDDLQHPPEEIPRLLAALTDDLDIVYAPPLHQQHGLLRDLASLITKLALSSAMGTSTARNVSAWRVFRTQLRDAFGACHSPLVNMDVLLTWASVRFGVQPLRHDPRTIGESNYTLGKLVRHALNMMTGFSVLPLQLASVIGFAFTLFGIAVLVYVLGRYFIVGSTVSGFPFLASIIAIFSGAQLFAIGIIGEYLARMHLRIMEKPAYAIQASTEDAPRP